MASLPIDQHIQAAIGRTVDRLAAGRITRDAAIAEIAMSVASAHLERTPAERMERDSTMFLAKFDEYGGDRWAAGKVGAFYGQDPLDCERIAQRVRKLDRDRRTGLPSRRRGRPQKIPN
jgi:hypothetical protein